MNYKVFLDDVLIHDTLLDLFLISPVLRLTDNATGMFEFGIAPNNPGYHKIRKLTSVITVFRNGEELYSGRVLTEQQGLEGIKLIACVGELDSLSDSIQRPAEYHNLSIMDFLDILITNHNNMTEESKHFQLGNVTVKDPNDSIYRYTNFENTWQAICEKIIDTYGGHFICRKENGIKYIDYLAEIGSVSQQVIEFGENLLDFTMDTNAGEIATVIIPLGARQEQQDGDPQALERRLTIESVNDGKDYIENQKAIKQFGRIVRTVNFDDVTEPENLKKKGEEYLNSVQFETLTLNLEAVDFNSLNADIAPLMVGDRIRVKSKLHGLDSYFPVLQRTYNLNEPLLDRIVLGDTKPVTIYESIMNGDKANSTLTMEQAKISSARTEAVRYFSAMAASMVGCYETVQRVNGASIHYWHDTPELWLSSYICKSSAAGTFFTTEGINSKNWKGVDKNGNALLESLTAKTISADVIKAGILKAIDPNSNAYFDLNTGELSATSMVSQYDIEFPGLSGKHNVKMSVEQVEFSEGDYACGLIFRVDGLVRCAVKVPFADGTLGGIKVIDSKGNSAGIDIGSSAITVNGDFNVLGGKKQRVVPTTAGIIGVSAYETAEPMFGDIGETTTGENGSVQIDIDSLFNETVNTADCPYQVFLQPYADGHFWVSKRAANYFVVNGPANAAFAWEIKAHQKGYEKDRLDIV